MLQSPLVSADWLSEKLDDQNLIILDASWHMPATGRKADEEFKQQHIPGARFFDIDAVCDASEPFPHTVPTVDIFEKAVSALGVTNEDTVVVYDDSDVKSSGRVWWLFRLMGHTKVYVLNGGLKKWMADGKPISTDTSSYTPSSYKASFQSLLFKSKEEMLAISNTKSAQIVDARGASRFYGREAEPRPGLRAGHIPGSLNLPFTELYREDGTIKSKQQLTDILADRAIDLNSPIVTSCGSGVTACNLALAFAELGKWDTAIYDGSWTEWGSLHDFPIETE